MTYLICEECGKEYPLNEGEESFSYEKCSCGGKLVYSPTTKTDPNPFLKHEGEVVITPQPSRPGSPIKWKGIIIGLLFLFVTLMIAAYIIFGNNMPTSPTDIPVEPLTYFSIAAIILTILAGSISSYLSGTSKFMEGALNGGMVGIILGFILGFVGGLMVFLSALLVFGLISMTGGIIGIFPRKLFK